MEEKTFIKRSRNISRNALKNIIKNTFSASLNNISRLKSRRMRTSFYPDFNDNEHFLLFFGHYANPNANALPGYNSSLYLCCIIFLYTINLPSRVISPGRNPRGEDRLEIYLLSRSIIHRVEREVWGRGREEVEEGTANIPSNFPSTFSICKDQVLIISFASWEVLFQSQFAITLPGEISLVWF